MSSKFFANESFFNSFALPILTTLAFDKVTNVRITLSIVIGKVVAKQSK
jgi:hypothetical protein